MFSSISLCIFKSFKSFVEFLLNLKCLWHIDKRSILFIISFHLSILRVTDENVDGISAIQWSHLPKLCSHENNSKLLKHRLSKLTIDFARTKTRLSSNERRSIREHFLYLAEQCRKLKDLKSAEMIVLNLADSAYKLPECKYSIRILTTTLLLGYNGVDHVKETKGGVIQTRVHPSYFIHYQ